MNRKITILFCFALFSIVITACNNVVDDAVNERFIGLDEKGKYTINNQERNATDISSESTTMSSNEFPHTKAVQIQEAKFEYEIDTNQQGKQHQQNINVNQGKQKQITKQWAKTARENKQKKNQWKNGQTQQNKEASEQQQQEQQQHQPEQEQQQEQQSDQQHQPEQQNEQPQQDEAEVTDVQEENENQATDDIGSIQQQVIDLTNAERRNNGLNELQGDSALSNVAQTKSTDMQENNYFSHTSPTYGSPFDMIRDFGVSYNSAAENIAQGQRTAEEVVQSWMNSEGHRKNILNGDFTHIGVGYDENGHHWTQMFIGR
ncbi:CAP domain-containing protein [Evansella sp. AB-P1]|uniref:CAP domain-containing protein n=1 Tax=Evansella sp. AB-P1 TaxID=3037653 RepID=UPI00241D388B|nr:CAP domain-containing protein [Evansella sp. AB-P1]MDG5787269.1 CAP domain-containing protein [Evansella sp. AB-P1]